MWVIGHTALAYLLIRAPTANKVRCSGRLIFFIFAFANIIDSLHYPYIRNVIHNPIGTIAYTSFCLWLLHRFNLIPRTYYFPLMLASLAHVAGDLLFSHYLLLLPFSRSGYTMKSWNSPEDLVAEIILTSVFLIILRRTGDLERVRTFMMAEYEQFAEKFAWKRILDPTLFMPIIVVQSVLFTFGQFLIDLVVNFDRLIHGVWYAWVFTAVFILFMRELGMIDILLGLARTVNRTIRPVKH